MSQQETLQINVNAKTKQAVADLQILNNQLRQTEAALKKATSAGEVTYLNRNISILKSKIAELNGVTEKSTSNLTAWTRVIQDSPYGFNAISNNLEQLVPAAGAAGLAFSGLIAAISFSSMGLQNWVRSSKSAQSQATDMATAIGSLNDVWKEGNKTAGEELIKLKYLSAAATNVNLSMQERLKAAKELKEEYPTILGNLSAEAITAGAAAAKYVELTQAVMANARAKAAISKITDLETAKLDALNNKQKIAAVTGKELANVAALGNKTFTENGQTFTQQQLLARITERRNKGLKEQDDIIASLTAQQNLLENSVGKSNLEKSVTDLKGTAEKADQVKKIIEDLRKELEGLQNQLNVGFINDREFNVERMQAVLKAMEALSKEGAKGVQEFDKLKKLLDEIAPSLNKGNLGRQDLISTRVNSSINGAPQQFGGNNNAVQDAFNKQEQIQKSTEAIKLYDQYAQEAVSITNLAAQAFTDLGQALLQGQSVGDALGNVFKKLAADIAAAAVKALLFKAILGIITGGSSTALEAITGKGGEGFGALFGKFLGIKLASGGITNGPTPALIGEAGPEAVIPLDRLGAFIDRAAKIGANSMGNGNGSPIVIGGILRGNDIWLTQQRTQFQRGLTTGF